VGGGGGDEKRKDPKIHKQYLWIYPYIYACLLDAWHDNDCALLIQTVWDFMQARIQREPSTFYYFFISKACLIT